jgi:hypothetical protein
MKSSYYLCRAKGEEQEEGDGAGRRRRWDAWGVSYDEELSPREMERVVGGMEDSIRALNRRLQELVPPGGGGKKSSSLMKRRREKKDEDDGEIEELKNAIRDAEDVNGLGWRELLLKIKKGGSGQDAETDQLVSESVNPLWCGGEAVFLLQENDEGGVDAHSSLEGRDLRRKIISHRMELYGARLSGRLSKEVTHIVSVGSPSSMKDKCDDASVKVVDEDWLQAFLLQRRGGKDELNDEVDWTSSRDRGTL